MKPRILVLPVAAIIITAMAWYRISREPASRGAVARVDETMMERAPVFEAVDSSNRMFRLDRHIGREPLILVFSVDGSGSSTDSQKNTALRNERPKQSADGLLRELKNRSSLLRERGFVVVVVSTALPQQNRRSELNSLFNLVTDVIPPGKAHRLWGCYDESQQQPQTGVFVIDRAGNTETVGGVPRPLSRPLEEIDALLKPSA